ncbi:hypothetical protein AB4519_20305 [Vibrio splendidus]|jgi:hypothetical protein|uniref:DUF7281 domain-containing protein n=1 Tax=Vibrio splendidus TaxID=29497 RepID=UPI000C864966|nr:hypothetical protein [Vibrio splendidus]MDH6016541.1 hypothetical protein [Vibrio splendidus]PMO22004.1 hypothetical protein BCT15_13755 [Vibrio splendidus]
MNIKVVMLAKKIVTLRLKMFPVSKASNQLVSETGIVHYRAKGQYMITQDELSEIERYYDEYLGGSLRLFTQESNRIDASKVSSDEKSAKGGVFEALLSIVPLCELHLTSGVISKDIKAIISVPFESLIIDKIDKLVVIENSELLVQSSRLMQTLPNEWQTGTLLVYRGHGESQKQIKSLLESLRSKTQVGFYFDYDLSGMKLINTLMRYVDCQASIITPRFTNEQLKRLTSKINYAKQYIEGRQLLTKTYESDVDFEKVIHQTTQNLLNSELSVTQESLVAHDIELVSNPLNWNETG